MGDNGVLPWATRLSYGVGHVLNDLCASMWFSYLLLYFETVNQFTNSLAGYVLLLGQVADAMATPLIGYESDRIKGFCGYGKRKSWHVLGTACVIVSFPFIFIQCISCVHSSENAQFVYYAPFIVIFQFGWASTQISHLAMIPELTSSDNSRVELNAIRYGFTVISSITVYGLTWIILSQAEIIPGDNIGPADAPKFREIALIVVGIGLFFSIIFHAGTPEKLHQSRRPLAQCAAGPHHSYGSTDATPSSYGSTEVIRNPYGCTGVTPNPYASGDDTPELCRSRESFSGSTNYKGLRWNDWLKEYQFYLVAVLYMCTRLIVNLSQIYLPMFVMHSIKLHKKYVAIVPLVVFAAGFVVSFALRAMNKEAGRKPTYLLGLLLVCGGCAWMWFLPARREGQMFGAAVFLGAGTSTILVTSLAMTADLIGTNVRSSAFVYGAMSFTDKLSNGAAVVLIQHFHPCNSESSSCCAACVWYYRQTIVFIPAGMAGLALIVLIIMAPMTIGKLRIDLTVVDTNPHHSEERTPVIGQEERIYETNSLIGSDHTDDDDTSPLIGPDPALNETQNLNEPQHNSAGEIGNDSVVERETNAVIEPRRKDTAELSSSHECRNESIVVSENLPVSV